MLPFFFTDFFPFYFCTVVLADWRRVAINVGFTSIAESNASRGIHLQRCRVDNMGRMKGRLVDQFAFDSCSFVGYTALGKKDGCTIPNEQRSFLFILKSMLRFGMKRRLD